MNNSERSNSYEATNQIVRDIESELANETRSGSPLESVVQPQQDSGVPLNPDVQPAATIRKWPRVYQIVWWWPADWTIGLDRFENSWMSLIYRWSFSVGPLEIRRWENCDRKIADKKLQREARS